MFNRTFSPGYSAAAIALVVSDLPTPVGPVNRYVPNGLLLFGSNWNIIALNALRRAYLAYGWPLIRRSISSETWSAETENVRLIEYRSLKISLTVCEVGLLPVILL